MAGHLGVRAGEGVEEKKAKKEPGSLWRGSWEVMYPFRVPEMPTSNSRAKKKIG